MTPTPATRRRWLAAVGICLFGTALLSACGDKKPAPPTQAASPAASQPTKLEPIKVRLAWVADMAEVGVFVAKEQGYFAKEGLDVTIEPGGFGLDPVKLVATGANEFGVGGAGNILLARAQGVPVVAIAAEFQETPVGFIVKAKSGIKDFKGFKGKRVGIQTGADTDVLYRALLIKNGMTGKDVREVPIQFDMTPFLSGAIDVLPGYVTNQPITLQGKGEQVTVITAASQGLSYYGNVFFTTEDRIAKHPEQVAKFVRAVRAGWQHALANKGDAVGALQKYTKEFDPKDLDQIYDAVMPFVRGATDTEVLSMTPEKWETTSKVLLDANLLKSAPDLGRSFTVQFLK